MRYRGCRVYRYSCVLVMLEEKFIRKTSGTRSEDSYCPDIGDDNRR